MLKTIDSYIMGTVLYIWYIITGLKIDDRAVRNAIDNDYWLVFKLYWKREWSEYNDATLSDLMIMSCFKRAVLFKSYKIIDAMQDLKIAMKVKSGTFQLCMWDLLSDATDSATKYMIRNLYVYDPTAYFAYNNGEFSEDMVEAATQSSTRWALDFIFDNQDFSEGDKKRSLALLQHIRMDNFKMVEAMIDYGFDVHVENDAAICVASRNCNMKIIRKLIDSGVSLEAHNFKAIRKALAHGSHELLDFYLEKSWKYIYNGKMSTSLAIKLIEMVAMGEQDEIEAASLLREVEKLRCGIREEA